MAGGGRQYVQELGRQVQSPDGRVWRVRVYRSGTFQGLAYTNAVAPAILWPIMLVGHLVHRLLRRGAWTTEVASWHNLPGPSLRETHRDRGTAEGRALSVAQAIIEGSWPPRAPAAWGSS